MSLTLVEQYIQEHYPLAWLQQAQQREALQHLTECDCYDCVPEEFGAYRLSDRGFPVKVKGQ